MCAYWYINKIQNVPLTPERIETDLLKKPTFIKDGKTLPIVTDELYVNSFDDLAYLYGLKTVWAAHIESPAYHTRDQDVEILVWKRRDIMHATGGDGKGHVTYDPLGYSLTVQYGKLVEKLILHWRRSYDNELFHTGPSAT